MNTSRAEDIFALAQSMPAGPERDALVEERCGGDADLVGEVRSLLQAHDAAGGFLVTQAVPSTRPESRAGGAASPGSADAVTRAIAVLGNPGPNPDRPLADLLADAPPDVAREARERIEAGFRIRALRAAGAGAPAPEPEEAPRLPGFRIERRLGGGGLGVVYAAMDEKLDRTVAIKVLRRRADATIRRRLLDEARKAAALDDPAIVTIYSVLDEADPPAIVMEWVDGFPLDRFAEHLNFEQKARLLREVARGLAVAHERGVIHRDLKPDNVMVGPEMRPRILDFGLALSLEEAGRAGRGFEGTPLYASPEQVRGQALGTASDVFSFGSLMFKVLTGRPPFAGETISQVLEAIATTSPPFPRDLALGIPEDLQAIALACLAWSPADRPSAATVALELGRFLAGEPVRLRPRLYQDLLRQRVSAYSTEVSNWEAQGIISREERDSLALLHRHLLADEDHWIIDARRLTVAQTVLYTGTWLVVVAAILLVWLVRDEVGPPWRWLAPLTATSALVTVGVLADRRREALASASFLAAAALSILPSSLALLKEIGWLAVPPEGQGQLFGDAFTNRQFLVSCLGALGISATALARLRLTGFAWTTAALGVASYLGVLLNFGWLDWPAHRQALGCLPLVAAEAVALGFENAGRVRWSMPYHLIALAALIGSVDVLAQDGPTLALLGLAPGDYLTIDRLRSLSLALNGVLFLSLMFATERAPSLDLRRGAKVLEIVSLLHAEGALFANALDHREDPFVRWDVGLYLVTAALFLVVGAWRGRWRMLVGALAGLALGSYLLVDLGLIAKAPFIFALGTTGLLVGVLAFLYLLRAPRSGERPSRPERCR